MKTKVVLYHKGCPDGLSGVVAALKFFGINPSELEYDNAFKSKEVITNGDASFLAIPERYGTKFDTLKELFEYFASPDERFEVYLIDFYERGFFELLARYGKKVDKVVIVDHHKTAADKMEKEPAREVFKGKLQRVVDLNHSAAVLSWKFFFGEKSSVPKLFEFVEDRDLWRWALENSEEVNAYLDAEVFNGEDVPEILKKLWYLSDNAEFEKRFSEIISKGKTLVKYRRALVREVIKATLHEVEIGGERFPAVNSTIFVSDIANELARMSDKGVGVVYSVIPKTEENALRWGNPLPKVKLSIRSTNGRAIEIARRLGGGGHDNAAGAVVGVSKIKFIKP